MRAGSGAIHSGLSIGEPRMILHPTSSRTRRFGLIGGHPADGLRTVLASRLDDGYHWFRALAPGGEEPIDTVVVGPGGTWAISFTDERGRFRRRNGHWYRWNRSTESWVPWDPRPVTAARLAGHRLSLVLERAGLPAAVEAVLVGGRGTALGVEPGERPGLHLPETLEQLARQIVQDEVLTSAQVDRIVALLDPRQPLPRLAPSTPRS